MSMSEEEATIKLLKEQKQYLIDEYSNTTEKKDKIIDLMAKSFKQDDVRTVEEIKQYFEKKVEEE